MDRKYLRSFTGRADSDRSSVSTISTVLPSYNDALQSSGIGVNVPGDRSQRGSVDAAPDYSVPHTLPTASPIPDDREERGTGTQERSTSRPNRVAGRSALSRPHETILQWTPPPPQPTIDTASHPRTYTFAPFSFNSMLLLPPPDASDTRPKYHISVILNCFMPASFITTVRRGASAAGEVVGEFEMGGSTERDTCTIGGMQEHMPGTRSWDSWRFHSVHWDTMNTDFKTSARCFHAPGAGLKANAPLLAVFTPRDSVMVRPRPAASARPATLEVMPDGQALFDEILLSALILERRRLTPRG